MRIQPNEEEAQMARPKHLCLFVIPSLLLSLPVKADDKKYNENQTTLSTIQKRQHDTQSATINKIRAAPPPPKAGSPPTTGGSAKSRR